MRPTTLTPPGCVVLAMMVLGPALLTAACRTQSPPLPAGYHRVSMEDGQISAVDHKTLPEVAWPSRALYERVGRVYRPGTPERPPSLLPQKIDSSLQKLIKEFPDKDTTVLIALRDTVKISTFLGPSPELSRKDALDLAKAHIFVLKFRRKVQYDLLMGKLKEEEGVVVDTFWLVSAVTAKVRLKKVLALAELDDVLSIDLPFPPIPAGSIEPLLIPLQSPRRTGSAAVDSGDTDPTVQDGRALINSDPYYDLRLADSLGVASTRIALLDTGVLSTHVLFNDPDHLGLVVDCIGTKCLPRGPHSDPEDDCGRGHGTSTAAILTGNDRLGENYRGVTADTLDSFKVYFCRPATPSRAAVAQWDQAAILRGLQAAVGNLDKVIVAEVQPPPDYHNIISHAADNAFQTGAVVIAAVGNTGKKNGVVAPALAQKVIAAGAFYAKNPYETYDLQGRGRVYDGRIKPDVQGPTDTRTAFNASDSSLWVFGGTSGSTPYVAGSAALLRNWLVYTSGKANIDPGHVYAQLILAGQSPYPFYNARGAGHLRLPPLDGLAWWGKVPIDSAGATIDIPLELDQDTVFDTLDAALWWPEEFFQLHNDIDLLLVDPGGNVQDTSASIFSIFERARVEGPLTPGTWTLRIQGYNMPQGPQTVYWAAHARRRKGS